MTINSFLVEQKDLYTILAGMQPICTKRTTLDATSTILFQVGSRELILKSTDLEISLQASCNIQQSTITEPISFLVPGKRIFELVKELDGVISCNLTNSQLSLFAGSVDVGLNIKDAAAFPPFPERIENLMEFEASFLSEMLDKVSFLIPQNNANPALNGLLLELTPSCLTMTATDGHCLAQVTSSQYTLEESKKWLLPRRAIFEIKKLLESSQLRQIFLGMCGNQLVFSGDSFNFFTKLLVDQFPQYQAILQKQDFVPATLERASFIKTLRRSVCFLSGQFLATTFSFNQSDLDVFMENKEVGRLQEKLSLSNFSGDKLDIRFYAPYLLNGLQVFNEDHITLYLKTSTKPVILEASKAEYSIKYLVMPVSPTLHA